jgi:hypothetical protein
MNRRTVSKGDRITCLMLTVFFMSYGWCAAASTPRTLRQQSKSDTWLVVQDKTGACRMSVPPEWKVEPRWPGHIIAPEQTETTLIAGTKRIRVAMSDADQKALEVDKLFENSPDFWFYSSKPISGSGGKPNLIVYHVNAVRDEGTCIAQILVNLSHPENEIRKIALSVKAAHNASVRSLLF